MRRQRCCSRIHLRGRGSAGRHEVPRSRGVHGAPELQGQDTQGHGHLYNRHRQDSRSPCEVAQDPVLQDIREDGGRPFSEAGRDSRLRDRRNGSFMAGECAGMVKKAEPAKAIIEDIIGGAERILAHAGDLLA